MAAAFPNGTQEHAMVSIWAYRPNMRVTLPSFIASTLVLSLHNIMWYTMMTSPVWIGRPNWTCTPSGNNCLQQATTFHQKTIYSRLTHIGTQQLHRLPVSTANLTPLRWHQTRPLLLLQREPHAPHRERYHRALQLQKIRTFRTVLFIVERKKLQI